MDEVEIKTPDGGTMVIRVPAGATDEQILRFAKRQYEQDVGQEPAPDDTEQKRGIVDEIGRQLGLTGRYVVEGVTAIPAMLSQPIASGADYLLEQAGSDFRFGNQAQAVSGLLDEAGFPQAENATERVVGDVSRGLVAGGGVIGLGKSLAAGAEPVAAAVGRQLAAAPGIQAIGDVAATGSAGVTRESGGSPEAQFVAGLAGGIAAPLAAQGAINVARNVGPKISGAASNVADTISQLRGRRSPGLIAEYGGDALTDEARKRLRSAKRMGQPITPAEATGDPILAARQGSLGTSEQGARELVDFGAKRTAQQEKAIASLLDDISPSGSSAAAEIRRTAAKILRDQQDALSAQAKPLYERAYKATITPEDTARLFDDPVLAAASDRVQKNPIYQKALAGDGPDRLRFWDIVKREIDDQAEVFKNQGERQKGMLLGDSKRLLTETMDNISDDYAAARAIYGEGARPLQALREGAVGRIATLSDDRLKSVSKILFDPNETNPKVLNQLRQQFIEENPDAWRNVIRNEIERRLDATKAGRSGSSFYNSILSKDRDFAMFMNATRGMPEVQRTLIDMRRIWKDIINPESVKGAAGKAKSSLDVPRSTLEAGVNWVKNVLGGKADKAAVRFITDPEWADDVARISKIKDQAQRERELVLAIDRVSQILPAETLVSTAENQQ